MKNCIAALLVLAWTFVSGLIHPLTLQTFRGPPGSANFGSTTALLPNGNFVVTDPNFTDPSNGIVGVGAVYLYSKVGQIISRLTGSTAGDAVGSSSVQVLASVNFFVRSPSLDNGLASNAGALTWRDGKKVSNDLI